MIPIGYSVIIPVKNGAKFLEDSVQSVLNQSFKPSEIIVVNDHSTDGTEDLVTEISKRADLKVILINSLIPGVSATRNIGIDKAAYDCIALLDADDIWLPKKMECQLRVYSKNKLVHTGFILVNEKLEEISVCRPENTPSLDAIFAQEYIVTGSSSSVIFSKTKFIEAGRFDESLAVAEDFDLWIRMSALVEIVGLQDPLVKIRRHKTSVQSDGKDLAYLNKELLSLVKVWRKNHFLSPLTRYPIENVLSNYFAATRFSPIYFFRLVFNEKFVRDYMAITKDSRFKPFEYYFVRLLKVIKYKATISLSRNKIFRGFHKTFLILMRKL